MVYSFANSPFSAAKAPLATARINQGEADRCCVTGGAISDQYQGQLQRASRLYKSRKSVPGEEVKCHRDKITIYVRVSKHSPQ